MNRTRIALSAAGGVAAVVLLSYLFVIPNMQVSNYKKTTETKQSQLNEKLNKVNDILDSDTFVKTDVEANKIRSDVKVGQASIKDAESTLNLVEKDLTGFSAYPLLDWNGSYQDAKELKNQEAKYIKQSRDYLTELKGVLDYFDKSADLSQKFEDFFTAAEAATDAETLPEYGTKIEEALKKLQPAIDQEAALQPPASLKEAHDFEVKATKDLVDNYKQQIAATKADDADKFETLATQAVTLADDYTKKGDDLNAKFVRESPLRKQGDALEELDRAIDRLIAKL